MLTGGATARERRRGTWFATFACAVAGGVFALAAPPTNVYGALWVGMALFAIALEGPCAIATRLPGAGRGLAFGVCANAVVLRFVPIVIERFTPLSRSVGWLALTLLCAFEGLRWAVAGWVTRAAMRVGVPLWAAFAIGVYMGAFLPTAFPWTAAGGATPWPAVVQLAEVVGERGVTLLMAATAGLVADSWLRGRAVRERRAPWNAAMRPLLGGAALTLGMLVWGAARMQEIEAQRARANHIAVALVQPTIGAKDRWVPENAPAILTKLTSLTRAAEERGAALTVWPEAAYPYVIARASTFGPDGVDAALLPGVRGPVLTGLLVRGAGYETFNSAAMVVAGGTLQVQDKVHLLWFGETVPFADRVSWLRRVFSRGTGLTPGRDFRALCAGAARAAVLNCFEDTLPDAGREARVANPNLLVNVTNDAWFVDGAPGPAGPIESRESELHLRLAVLRAVEQRRDLVRAVNVGATSWVDATGRVRARYSDAAPAALMSFPALLESAPTPYARFGDGPLLTALPAYLAFRTWRARRPRQEPASHRGKPSVD